MSEVAIHYKANDVIAGLRVLSVLGQGAASTIYLAQDQKTKQIWAVKHVHRTNEKDERFLEQAVSEYEIARNFDHPNIRRFERLERTRAKLFTVLTDVLLVMEFVDGVSLEKYRPKTYVEALEIFEQVALAMAHMHEKGYIHADMKPNNIMVCPGSVAKVIDLGQSCKNGTIKPRIQGTPDYIAPEQVFRKPITPPTDVYNLGATMYWVFTKTNIPTAMNQGENSLVDRIDPSLMPRPTPAISLDPKLHPKLNELIMHCVEVDPNDRPDGMRYIVDRLNLIRGMLKAQAMQKQASPKGPQDTRLGNDPGASSGGSKGGSAITKLDARSSGSTAVGVRVDPG